MLVGILIVLNIPVYVLLAKLILPDYEVATVIETALAVLWLMFASRIARIFVDVDGDDSDLTLSDYVRVLLLLTSSALVICGEYWLIDRYW